MFTPNADLDDLQRAPTLDVEVKEWLDLTDNDHRAMIAKEQSLSQITVAGSS